MKSEIRDLSLAASGARKIEWVERNCDLLRTLRSEFLQTLPFQGKKIALSVHHRLQSTDRIHLCDDNPGSQPLCSQSSALSAEEEYFSHIRHVLENGPNIIIDDGGDLINMIHNEMPELIPDIIGGCEETTTGINRLEAMNRAGKLAFPMIRVNNAACKHFFDNRYGTGQSVWDGICRTTNLIVAGKVVVVSGYGWCGKGTALRAKGLGARVVVTEVDPIRALEAVMDGFFVTVTGCDRIIGEEIFPLLKDGAILCNAGHFDTEIDMAALRSVALEQREQRKNIMGYHLPNGRWIFVLGEGRLVNLACADGHPAEIMDMSFAIQALSAKYLVEHAGQMTEKLIDVPYEVDRGVAERKLAFMGKKIDTLTPEQERYLNSYNL